MQFCFDIWIPRMINMKPMIMSLVRRGHGVMDVR